MDERSRLSRTIEWTFQEHRLPYVALFAIAATALSHFASEKWGEAHKILHAIYETSASFFEAMFIAAFLALVVDPVLKRDLLKDGLRGMFRYVYGFYLPDEVQNFWDERIIREVVIRRSYEIRWDISLLPGSTDRVAIRLRMEFKPENFTGQQVVFRHKATATADAPGETGRVDAMYADSPIPKEKYHFKNAQELEAHRDGTVFAGEPIELPPSSEKGKKVICGAHYFSEGAALFGTDRVNFSQLSANVHVRVCVSEELRDLKLSLIPSLHKDSGPRIASLSPTDRQYCCEWHLDQLFIPNERLVLRWEK